MRPLKSHDRMGVADNFPARLYDLPAPILRGSCVVRQDAERGGFSARMRGRRVDPVAPDLLKI